MRTIIDSSDAEDIGGLAAASCTLEEFYLLQKFMRGMGSNNVDHRLQQSDFRGDDIAPLFPGMELPIAGLNNVKAAFLIGANLRKEQPLLSVRLRHAVMHNGAKVGAVNIIDYPQNYDLIDNQVSTPANLLATLAQTARSIAKATDKTLPEAIASLSSEASSNAIAAELVAAGEDSVVILGANAQQHQQYSDIKSVAEWICEQTGAKLGILAPANSAAAWLAGCIPHRSANGVTTEGGENAAEMLADGKRGFILLGTEPELDAVDSHGALSAMKQSEFVVQISAYQSEAAMEYADVLLPMTAFTESAGTFVNCEGRVQKSSVATNPMGEARPGWKILRVLGNFLELDGFNYITAEDVAAEVDLSALTTSARNQQQRFNDHDAATADGIDGLQRIVDMPMYRGEATLRHANALQLTADNPAPAARVHPDTIASQQLSADGQVTVVNGKGQVELQLVSDNRVPPQCVYIPAGFAVSSAIGMGGSVTLTQDGNQ